MTYHVLCTGYSLWLLNHVFYSLSLGMSLSSFCPLEPDSAVFDSTVSKTCMPDGCGGVPPLQLPSHPPRLPASHLHSLTSLALPHHGHLITAVLSVSSDSVPTGALAITHASSIPSPTISNKFGELVTLFPTVTKCLRKSNVREKEFIVALSSWVQSITVGKVWGQTEAAGRVVLAVRTKREMRVLSLSLSL